VNLFDCLHQQAVRADPLSEALEGLRLHSKVMGQCELSAPWGIRVANDLGWWYVVTGRAFLLTVEGTRTSVLVSSGDLAIVPPGRVHELQDGADSPVVPIEALVASEDGVNRAGLRHGGGGVGSTLVCGCFLFEDPGHHPLQTSLPNLIQVRGEGGQPLPYVDCVLRFIAHELESDDPGSQTIINRLVRILLIKAVRSWATRLSDDRGGWLGAAMDAHIGPALGLMHNHPEEPWTVASLAERVAMSRSVFSARFTKMVGKPPLQYLTECRMEKACRLLRQNCAGLKEIALQVGYDSAASFSKAYRRRVGITPGTYRNMSGDAATPGSPRILHQGSMRLALGSSC
jgi:AraC-like DNA-binding protein